MNNDLISRSELKKAFEDYEAHSDIFPKTVYDIIDNAPTVEQNERQKCDCENCPFKKFSEDMVGKLANLMADNGITDFDEFAKCCGVSYLHQDSITKSDTQL